jgi:hypothetical protein
LRLERLGASLFEVHPTSVGQRVMEKAFADVIEKKGPYPFYSKKGYGPFLVGKSYQRQRNVWRRRSSGPAIFAGIFENA